MKIRVKKTSLLLVCIIMAIIILDNFFGFGIPIGVNTTYLLFGVLILSFIIGVYLLPKKFSYVVYNCKFINIYVVMVLVSYIVLFGYSLIEYPMQGIKETLSAGAPYLALLFIYPIYVYLIAKGNEKSIYRMLNIFSIIIYLLILVQFVTYGRGIMIFSEETMKMRNERIRIGLHFYGNFMLLYNFYKMYIEKDRKLFRILLVIVGFFELFYIQQTRAYTLVILFSIFIMIVFEKNTRNKLLKKGVIVILAIAVLLQTNIVSSFIQSLSSVGEEAGSTIGRQYSMAYYLSMFKIHFPLGLAFPNIDKYGTALHHQVGVYTTYVDDVGIIGQLGILGLLIIPIFIIPVVRMIYVVYKMSKNKFNNQIIWYLVMLIYIIMTSGTLMILDSYRIMLMPIIMALVEFQNEKINRVDRME